MKGWHIGFLLVVGGALIETSTGTVIAQDLTCRVQGDSFILDDTDFKALAPTGITKEKFAALAPTSKDRVAICNTRKLWRLIKAGNADTCDFDRYDPVIAYFDKSERPLALKAITLPHAGKCL
jgi:hypothetical protein